MLNRIYIIVGTLAIIILAGAFIAPRFIQWGDYRARMEELAASVLGTPVAIRGDIEFSLLPQPRLGFSDVIVGPPEAPAATVAAVDAEFSLMEFLRDDYNITRLVLRGPVIDFTVDESGFLGSGFSLEGAHGVALAEASVEDATLRLVDRRSGQSYTASDIAGQLRLSSFSGPFAFQGTAAYEGALYAVRFNSAELDELGNTRISTFLQAQDGGFSFQTDGVLTPGMAPKYDGTLTYRVAPEEALAADEIQGDLVFESKVTGSTDRIVLAGYTLQPDENRAGTRLTGAASIQLGARLSFDAVISGGVFSLHPRDANEDASVQPYEVVRLLGELPAPIVPPIPGRIGVDLAEVGLRSFSVRNVRLDAATDGTSWTIEQFIGDLPGDTEVRVNGVLEDDGGRPGFQGTFSVTTARLDALAALWRKPSEDNPLFNQPGQIDGQLMLVGDALGLHDASLTLAGQVHGVELRVGFGDEKRLDVVGHFAELGPGGSAIVGAMLPAINSGPAFGISFPYGSFALTAGSARVLGLDGTMLRAEGQWAPDSISFSRLAATGWGGIDLDGTLRIAGPGGSPEVSAQGRVGIPGADAAALVAVHEFLDTPDNWRNYLARLVPVDITVDLGPPDGEGAQVLTANGVLGAGTLTLRTELARGLADFADAPLRVSASLEGTDANALGRQMGLGQGTLFAGEGLLLTVGLEGTPSNSLTSSIVASSGAETLGFGGQIVIGDDGELGGTGRLDVALADAGGLAQIVGASGLSFPAAEGTAQLHFEGDRLVRLTEISGTSGETGFSGELSVSRTAGAAAVAGALFVDAVSIEGLAATLFGPAALVPGSGIWPEGPIAIGAEARRTRGTVAVTAGSVTAGGDARMGEASFELTWDDARLRLARFEAAIGDGTGTADITVCCAGPLADKTVSGRIGLNGVSVDLVATPALAGGLDGTIDGGLRFESTGISIADAMASVSGEGNFTISDLAVDQMAPGVFPTVAGLDGLLDMDPDALGAIISLALGQGAFTAPQATGAFTLAGGVVRLSNMIIEGDGAGLAGSVNLALVPLALDGAFTLTPRDFTDPAGLVSGDTSRIVNRIAGTLLAPLMTLDLEEMVAAIQVRANELEVERLEILRAEDAERQRAAAEERNRLIEEQRRRAAEEAARIAAEEEAARLAAEEEARRLEEEQLLLQQQSEPPTQPQSPSIITLPEQQFDQPLDLGLPPAVNQPVGPGVNQLILPTN